MPRIEQLHQNTPDWHRWRQQGIGASDAPVIMGDGAFKTPRTLWSIKTGRMQEGAAGLAARRGRELERLARRVYEQQTGTQMEPLCLVHDELEWMRASLDGLSFDGSIVLEIKCPMSFARPHSCATGKGASPALRATATRARGRAGGRAPLLVVRWYCRKPGQGASRPRIPEAAFRCRGCVLAAGEAKRLA
jgi:putative phage-type endonuclease